MGGKLGLSEHYSIHFNFLREYLSVDGVSSVLQEVNRLGVNVDELIDNDIDGIMEIVDKTRKKLLKKTNHRLLIFIDPDTVDVQIGNFLYTGIEAEDEFISRHREQQAEISQAVKMKEFEIDKARIKRETEEKILEEKTKTNKARMEAEKEQAKYKKEEIAARLSYVFDQAIVETKEALESGDVQKYAILALTKAHQEGGIEAVEALLEKSPNILMTINPDIYQVKEVQKIKHDLVEIIGKTGSTIDPLTLSLLFSRDFKDVLDTDIYKKVAETLTETLKSFGMGRGFPFYVPSIVNGQNKSDGHKSEKSE